MKDMLAELNQMLEQRASGRGARLRRVHGALRRLLPREPPDPRRAAGADGPAHGRHAGDAQLDDARAAGAAPEPVRPAPGGHGPALAGRPARPRTCAGRSPTWTGTAATTSRARTPWASPRPRSMMEQLGRPRPAREPAAQRHRTPARWPRSTSTRSASSWATTSAESLERLAELAKLLEEAGPHREQGGPVRAHRQGHAPHRPERPRRPVQASWPWTRWAATRSSAIGIGHERAYDTKPYEFGDPFNLHIERTVRNAVAPPGAGHPGAAHPGRLRGRAHRAPGALEHGADARPVAVDADAGQLPARQEGGDGAALADLQPLPAGLPRHRRLQRGGPGAHRRAAARGLLGLRLRHQHAARLPAQPAGCWPASRAPSRSS